MLRLEKIVVRYNEGLPVSFQLTSEKVSTILNKELFLSTKRTTGNYSYLVWEDEKLKKYFKQTLTTLTTLTQKAEKQTVVNDVNVDCESKKEISEEITEVEYVEVVSNV